VPHMAEPKQNSAARLVASLAKKVGPPELEAECAALLQKNDTVALSAKLQKPLLQALASAKEAEARNAFAILLELLVQWQLLTKQAEALATALIAAGLAPELMCTLLLSLYSLAQQYGSVELRFSLLTQLIAVCAKSGLLDKVLGPPDGRIARIERWVSAWKLSAAQQKELWKLVFETHAGNGHILYEAALQYFALHADADLKASPELCDVIVKALLTTIRSPSCSAAKSSPSRPSSASSRRTPSTRRCTSCSYLWRATRTLSTSHSPRSPRTRPS